MKLRLAAALLLAAPALAGAETSTWKFDPAHTSSTFAVKHLVVTTVRGSFGKTTGTISVDDQDLSKSSVQATVDVTSISTANEQRDAHLKSADFFDAANHPTLTFKSTKVEKAGDGKLKVSGDLTMRGTTKPVVFDVTYSPQIVKGTQGEQRRAFSGTTRVNRKDFGLAWSKTVEAGPVVADDVDIEVNVEAVKDASQGTAGNKEEAKPPTAAQKDAKGGAKK